MKKILCIDYGRRNLGFAFTESLIPDPLNGIKIKSTKDLIAAASGIVNDFEPELVVIGLPEGELKKEVQEFARSLEKATQVKTTLHPETLSSQEAVQKLRQAGAKKKKLANDHSYAAALILEDYLLVNDS